MTPAVIMAITSVGKVAESLRRDVSKGLRLRFHHRYLKVPSGRARLDLHESGTTGYE